MYEININSLQKKSKKYIKVNTIKINYNKEYKWK